MANEGILITGAMSAIGGLLFAFAADRLRLRRYVAGRPAGALCWFYAILAAFLFVTGLREAVAYVAQDQRQWIPLDAFLFYALATLVALSVPPLMHLAAEILTGSRRAAWVTASAFTGLAALGISGLLMGGLDGPITGAWGSDWTIRSRLTIAVLAGGGMAPAAATAVLLRHQSRRLPPDAARHARATATSLFLVFVILMLGALGITGILVLGERGVYLLAAWMAYDAQRKALMAITAGAPGDKLPVGRARTTGR